MRRDERDQLEDELRANLPLQAPALQDLLESASDHWGYEDPVYRFYHQSFKVYWLQQTTQQIVVALGQLLPARAMNPWFRQIVANGTCREFTMEDNQRWLEVTRPILEAFFHARYFLEMACRHHEPPEKDQSLPSGWAALLYLFELR